MIENTSQTQLKIWVIPSLKTESFHPAGMYAYIYIYYLNAILDINIETSQII